MKKLLTTAKIIRLICLFLVCGLSALITPAALAANCPPGDLNRDCKINFLDFRIMAENWLEVEPNLPVGSVIINEVMSHSHSTASDWIELYNTTGSTINIGGWYLSDSGYPLDNLAKYTIPNGTTIAPYGYIVFYENVHFGVGANAFGFSENGETAYLSLYRDGKYFGMDDKQFAASDRNVSFGLHTTSIGDEKFVSMDSNTPGQTNAYPKVGPIVISEIMYNYNSADNDLYEYIELHNIKNYDVNMWVYDTETLSDVNWAITKGVTYTFPKHTIIPAYGYVVVARDWTTFHNRYPSVPQSIVFSPFSGKLSNEGEDVEISMPGHRDIVDPNIRYYVRIDNVSYSDGKHHENFPGLDPWMYTYAADGTGQSLKRIDPNRFGDDVNNWESASANPGV